MSDFYDMHARRYQYAAISRAVVIVAIAAVASLYFFFSYRIDRNTSRSACIHDGLPPKECERIFP